MMKWLSYVLLASVVWWLPSTTHAACVKDANVAALLEQDPIGDVYLAAVIDRTKTGLNNAKKGNTLPFSNTYFFGWVGTVGTSILALVDTEVDSDAQTRRLRTGSACLELDRQILEAYLEETRCELNQAFADVNIEGISTLIALRHFLNARYHDLLLGYRDPTYEDRNWSKQRFFEASPPTQPEPMCPFHSTYLPFTGTMGCGPEQLAAAKDTLGIAAEYQALQELVTLRRTVDSQRGAGSARPYVVRQGCDVELGDIYAAGGSTTQQRGPFSVDPDQQRIIEQFLDLRQAWGLRRPPATYLREEQTESSFEREDARKTRAFFREWSQDQALKESAVIAKAFDARLQIGEAVVADRTQLARLARLASQRDAGVRKFTTGFAWYLRRSCAFRPCNQQLGRVLNLTLNDACFPYTNGAFVENPGITQQCR